MSSLVRTLIGVCAAVPIALGLFFLMNSLIDRQFEQDEIKLIVVGGVLGAAVGVIQYYAAFGGS